MIIQDTPPSIFDPPVEGTIIDKNGPFPLVFKKFQPADIKFNPVQVNKTWNIYSGSFNSSNYSHIPLNAIYWSGNELPWVSKQNTIVTGFDDIGKIVTNVNGSWAFNTYNSIYNSYYKYKTEPSKTLGLINLEKASRFLYQKASVFSIPQKKFGLRIKPTSFIFSGSIDALIYGVGLWGGGGYGVTSSINVNLSCDKYENIFDTTIDTGSFPSDCKFYEGFNEYFDTSRVTGYRGIYGKYAVPTSAGQPDRIRLDIGPTYPNGVTTNTGVQLPIGLSGYFSGSEHLEKDYGADNKAIPGTYDRDNNYAISFYIKSGSNTSTTNELILAKRLSPDVNLGKIDVNAGWGWTKFPSTPISSERNPWRYPFSIELSGSNQIEFSVGSGAPSFKTQITSSTYVSSSWAHILCQKSGSNLQMYIDGTLHSSASSDLLLNTNEIKGPTSASRLFNNNETLKIGGYPVHKGGNGAGNAYQIEGIGYNLHGYLDEMRIYNKSLTQSEITTLADRSEGGGLLQTNRVGNIFYNTGIIVISSPDYRYDNTLLMNYTGSYQSTKNIYEFNSQCKIKAGDFNLTTNPSALRDDNETYLNYMTGSSAQPYFTTIGLYNKDAQLMATAKLGTPLQKRTNIDMNILVRVDLDKPKPMQEATLEDILASMGTDVETYFAETIWNPFGEMDPQIIQVDP